MKVSNPAALTIAGFDPSGGAGVLADVRTFAAFGLTAVGAVTSITFQNHRLFFGAVHQTAESVRAQIEALLHGNRPANIVSAKTGMLPTREVVMEVARLFRDEGLPAPVVDPVLISSSGSRLMDEDAVGVLVQELFPVCRLLTPNIPEAEELTGMLITSEAEMRQAAAEIRRMGARSVLLKGGHLRQEAGGGRHEAGVGGQDTDDVDNSKLSIDVLDDDGMVTVFRSKRVDGVELHGSGCVLSAAIAAGLGNGLTLEKAVTGAKSFVLEEFRKLVG